ncbi:MAG: haloacid dehalogenase-like hydrolase [Candidatus Aminicenantes bacterium]|nr:haloacid dehalogenase-like hydrolase [Candidatus Aminicenantes bacterium]
MPLQRLNWNERNYQSLQRFIPTLRRDDIAVFDWDNTCILGDIGEAVFRHQARYLEFKFSPQRLQEIIPEQVHGIGHIRDHDRLLPLSALKGQIVGAYEKIFDRPRNEIRADSAYHDFSAGLLALNRGLEETPGIGCEFAYPWTLNFLQGFSPDDVRRLAATVMDNELQTAIRRRSLSDSREHVTYSWVEGIRLFPEMADLAHCFNQGGCRVIISTASNQLIVETMAARVGFAAEHVIGMDVQIENGTLSGTLAPGPAPNFGPGKALNLRRRLEQEPVFVAGDSSGDYDMVTVFHDTRLKLLIRREQPGKMIPLYQKALAGDPQYLLQDVDRNGGSFLAAANQGNAACKRIKT